MADGISIEEPFPEEQPTTEQPTQITTEPDEDAEPEGAIQVGDKRLVDVSVVAAERKRARDLAEKKVRETELAPLQEQVKEVEALRAAVAELKPYAAFLQQNPHLMQRPKPTPLEEQIPEEDAIAEARDLELFDPQTGKPDVARARRIIAKRVTQTHQAAQQAASQAVAPLQARGAEQAMRDNFVRALSSVEDDEMVMQMPGLKEAIAQQFVELGPDMTQHPQVAQVALERAIGRAYLERRKTTKSTPTRSPVFSEASGGAAGTTISYTERAKKMGLTQDDLKTSNKTFKPGDVSEIGSW